MKNNNLFYDNNFFFTNNTYLSNIFDRDMSREFLITIFNNCENSMRRRRKKFFRICTIFGQISWIYQKLAKGYSMKPSQAGADVMTSSWPHHYFFKNFLFNFGSISEMTNLIPKIKEITEDSHAWKSEETKWAKT